MCPLQRQSCGRCKRLSFFCCWWCKCLPRMWRIWWGRVLCLIRTHQMCSIVRYTSLVDLISWLLSKQSFGNVIHISIFKFLYLVIVQLASGFVVWEVNLCITRWRHRACLTHTTCNTFFTLRCQKSKSMTAGVVLR